MRSAHQPERESAPAAPHCFIFDFDGTIADSFEVIMRVACELLHRPPLTPAEIKRLRQLSSRQAAKVLGIALWRVPFLVWRGRRRMRGQLGRVPVFAGMPELLDTLHNANCELFIVSSNSEQNVHAVLHTYGFEHDFVHVYGDVGLNAKAKVLGRILRDYHIASGRCWYVGDEVRDIDAATRAGVHAVAVTWGFNGQRALAARKPFAVARNVSELERLLIRLANGNAA